jgi:hypothetical protein
MIRFSRMSAILNPAVPVKMENSRAGLASNLGALEGIAGAAQGRATLGMTRADRDRAFALVANVELALAQGVVRVAEESGRS